MAAAFYSNKRARLLLSCIIMVLAVVFIWRNWDNLLLSLAVLGDIPTSVLIVAVYGVVLTFLLAALSYRMLVFRRVRFGELFLVELAAAFVNRVVPSGLGGLGAHGVYLRTRKHSVAQATAVVSTNNLIGICTHVLLFSALLVFVRLNMAITPQIHVWQFALLIVALSALVVVSLVPAVRKRLQRFWGNLRASLQNYHDEPHTIVFAALALTGLTLTNLLVLYVLSHAVGIQLDVPQVFMVYSVGVLFGTLMPTPGGLVGVEAGLATGFMAYGVPADVAIAAAFAFRLVTYWIPLIPGAIAFAVCRRKHVF